MHDAEKLSLAHFPPVEVEPNLALLSKEATYPNKQCWVSEVILKAYSVCAFTARLENYNSILVAYQSYLLWSLFENHRPSPQQLDELRLVNKNLLRVFKLNGQAVGRNLASSCKEAAFVFPRMPRSRYEMLQCSHCSQESTKEPVRLLHKLLPPVRKPAANWHPRPQQPQRLAQTAVPAARGDIRDQSSKLLAVEALIGSASWRRQKLQAKPQAEQQP
ncbi:UNVERIFIED_CONTAM: hypothetical protein FKN15_073140 [Acipenser sinensis]